MPMNRGLIRALPREFPSFRGLTINGPLRSVYYGDNQSPQFSGTDNVVIGDSAGQSMRAAAQCVVIGSAAGQSLLDASTDGSVFVGYAAGQSAVASGGLNDICIGFKAGLVDTAGKNVFIGYLAGTANTTGTSNVCIGWQAGKAITTAQFSTIIGYNAGAAVSTLNNSTFYGYSAGVVSTSNGATLIGTSSGQSQSTGVNTMVGYQSGYTATSGNATTTGTRQTLIGYNTGATTSTQLNDIVCVGDTAQTSGGNCVLVGSQTIGSVNSVAIGGSATTKGTDSIAIGNSAITWTGTYCIAIGTSSGGSQNTSAGSIFIGYATGNGNQAGVNVFIGYQSGYTPSGTNKTTTATGQTCLGWNTGQASTSQVNYITCLGYSTTAGAAGCVAIGTDSGGNGATTSVANEIKLGTANHTTNLIGKSKILAHAITSGALSTTTFVSGTGKQIDTTSDRVLVLNVSITLATDTVQIEISPDNTTYSSLGTYTPGVAASNDMFPITVPSSWYVRITLTGSAAITTATYY